MKPITSAELTALRKSRHEVTAHKPCSKCGETDSAKFGWYNICRACKNEAKRLSRIRRGERVAGVDRRFKRDI